MHHITVSGIDKSGKSTIIKAFMEKTNYKHYVVDRDPSNYFALNVARHRIQDERQVEEYGEFIAVYRHCVSLAVLVTCEVETLEKRFKKHNEPPLPGHLDMKTHQELIEKCFDSVGYTNTLKIDTTFIGVEQAVKLIELSLRKLDHADKQFFAGTSSFS